MKHQKVGWRALCLKKAQPKPNGRGLKWRHEWIWNLGFQEGEKSAPTPLLCLKGRKLDKLSPQRQGVQLGWGGGAAGGGPAPHWGQVIGAEWEVGQGA